MDKKKLRRQMIDRRDSLTKSDRERRSGQIRERLWQWEAFRRADIILSYASFRSEVDTEKINHRILEEGRQLFLPKTFLERHEMVFYRIRGREDLVRGYQGIPEPVTGEIFVGNAGEQQTGSVIMLMPGVAFDAEGNRLGYGGGYYDRYLADYGDKINDTCMLAFDIQFAERIEVEKCDIRPNRILTDRR